MTRYDWIQLAQLVFALVVMMGAFGAGLALGWWRWGRAAGEPRRAPVAPAPAASALFSPDDADEIDLTVPTAHTSRGQAANSRGLFTPSPHAAGSPEGNGDLPAAARAAIEPAPVAFEGGYDER